ncbi:hypothetical protein ACH5RR_014230 [Cinchona calisaya]|uniref:RNase H type-1 domain-containing protein n=1 Tax=Cinchona calisaya TaxID=153742 RepID=A0ABD3A844_9GENT
MGARKKDKAAAGIIIRDDQGEIMVALSEPIGRPPDASGAEIMPLLIVVQFAMDNDIEDMVLEGDNLQTSNCVRTSHVRQRYVAEHVYAKFGKSISGRNVWWDNFPNFVCKVSCTDARAPME